MRAVLASVVMLGLGLGLVLQHPIARADCPRNRLCLKPGVEQHTSCKFERKPSNSCTLDANELTIEEENSILSLHNHLRNKLAAGKVDGFQRALDMQPLKWDSELEDIAQTWADQCKYGHDECRNVERWWVGQNIASTSASDGYHAKLKEKVMMWWDEYKMYGYKDGTFQFNAATGHFTQMAWAKTNSLGCGRSTYKDLGGIAEYLVCNYGPAGNIRGQKMYKAGAEHMALNTLLVAMPLLLPITM